MPRRRALTEAQLESLLALPTTEADLVRHWTLDRADLAAVDRRRGGHNQFGFTLQLCALRYPGRLLRPGELIPAEALRFVAAQLGAEPEALASYAARFQTRYEQLDALREAFGFTELGLPQRREILAWLLPVALATTGAPAIAQALMEELRRRRVIAPGPSIIERLVAAALVLAERHVAHQLTRGLTPAQAAALDALLRPKEGTPMSMLAWARQPPGAPGHRALARIIEQIGILRAVGLDPACIEGVHPERLRKLAREGGRFTAQHLRALSPLRRRATLVATVLDTMTRLTDDGVALFDRAVGRMFRRAEVREEDALLRKARVVNDKMRLFAKLGAALIEAKAGGADLDDAVAAAVGWDKLAASVAEAERPPRRWGGTSGRKASPKPSASRGRTRRTCRRWPRVPGQCCTGSAPCSSTRSPSAPGRPPPPPCAQSKCYGAHTAAASANGHKACRPAFSGLPGARRCWAREAQSAAPGRRPPCSRYAIGCAPATSGSRAAGSGGPSRTSSSHPPCSPPCARPGPCRSPCPRRPKSIWPSAALCLSGAWPR